MFDKFTPMACVKFWSFEFKTQQFWGSHEVNTIPYSYACMVRRVISNENDESTIKPDGIFEMCETN